MHLSSTPQLMGPVATGTATPVLRPLPLSGGHEKGPLIAALVFGYFKN
jgi:hypothetical protein